MSWWWTGAIGAVKKRQDEQAAAAAEPSYQSTLASSSDPPASLAPPSSTSSRSPTPRAGRRSRTTEAENREDNTTMLRNVLSVVVPNCSALVHVCLQTGHKHYVGPFKAIGKVATPDPPFTEDMSRLDCPSTSSLLALQYLTAMIGLFAEASRDSAGNWTRHQPMGRIWIWSLCFLDSVSSICGRRRSTKLISICKFWSNWNTRENILVLKAGLED